MNEHLIKVSVIIPVYNVEAYISDCLDSVVNQTLSDIEVVIVDDCGTDASMDIVNSYTEQDSRFRIISHDVNKGLSKARRTGIESAAGEYIFHLDSDDYISANALEQLYKKAVLNSCDIVMGQWNVFSDTKKPYEQNYFRFLKQLEGIQNINSLKGNIFNLPVSCCNKLFNKHFLGSVSIPEKSINYMEDLYYSMSCMCLAQKIGSIAETTYFYRQNPDSILRGRYQYYIEDASSAIIGLQENISEILENDKQLKCAFDNFAVKEILRALRKENGKKRQQVKSFLRNFKLTTIKREYLEQVLYLKYAPFLYGFRLKGFIKKMIFPKRLK